MNGHNLIHKICVVGAESTGTTTLTKSLAHHFQTVWVPEYGRTYAEGKLFLPTYSDWDSSEFEHIAQMQSDIATSLLPRAQRYIFWDTDAFATSVWHRRYMERESAEVLEIAKHNKPDLYLLTAPDIPFEQDGTRDGEHIRHWMHDEFARRLSDWGVPFEVVSGSPEVRLQQALMVLQKHFVQIDSA